EQPREVAECRRHYGLSPVQLLRAEGALGPARDWIAGYQRFSGQGMPWMTLIPTWQCELRCTYCGIVKQGGREMSEATVDAALDMLLASDQDDVAIHFFGGEPFMGWPAVERAIREGHRRVSAEGRRIHFLITTNGYAVTEEQLDWLAQFDVSFELSLDGDPETMATFRHGRGKGENSYVQGVAGKARWFQERRMPHTVIQVVHPDNVGRMVDNFRHILDLGFRTLQLNFAVGPRWSDAALSAWAEGLHGLGAELERRWAAGDDVMIVNLKETLRSFRVNLHPAVDWDGTIYAGTPFLYMEGNKPTFRLGHLDDGAAVHRYVVDSLHVEDIYANWSLKGSASETRRVGAVQKSFIRWMRARHPDRLPAEATPLGATARAREREREPMARTA
ncbi:MAG: radical SAM protein, partial [Deltaproteobacteria bacterium]